MTINLKITVIGLFGLYRYFTFGSGDIIVTPEILAVTVGQKMLLECRTGNKIIALIKWTFTRTVKDSETHNLVTAGERVNSRYQQYGAYIDGNATSVLYKNATNLEDAGKYTCGASIDGTFISYSAQLIVFKSQPLCSSNLTLSGNRSLMAGDLTWMMCSVEYSGNRNASMIWKQYSLNAEQNENKTITTEITENMTSQYVLKSLVYSLVLELDSQSNASYFEFNIRFVVDINGSQEIDTDMPNSSYTWMSPMIFLMMPKEDVTNDVTTKYPSSKPTSIPTDPVPTGQTVQWFFISITLATILFLLIAILACVYCIKIRRKSKDKANELRKKTAISGEYDFISQNFPDGYDELDITKIQEDVPMEFAPRQGLLPTAGYAALMPAIPVESSYYSQITYSENPEKEDTNAYGEVLFIRSISRFLGFVALITIVHGVETMVTR